MNHRPLVFLTTLQLEPPSTNDKTSDADRVRAAFSESGLGEPEMPLGVLRRIPLQLREHGYTLKAAVGIGRFGPKLIDFGIDRIFGLAVDIGSTNIECTLFDLENGRKLDELHSPNPQIEYGSDVLTRVQYSMTGKYDRLHELLLSGINSMIRTLCERNGVKTEEICALAVAGNTIMSHFFLGLDVNNIPVSPYIPVVNSAVLTDASAVGLQVNPNAMIYVFPNSGSYVGGDIISGMLYSKIYDEPDPVLFIDVGTNVEITLGCRDWIMTGAGAAGPALEGGVASIGKKAEPGTISKVSIDAATRAMKFDVIGDIEPSGICGSGLVDLVSEMRSANLIDQSGKFTDLAETITDMDGTKTIVIHKNGSNELLINEAEIRNFLISKAAMFSFLYVFVKSVGLTFSDLRKVYVAGALGCGINPESAVKLGMLPDIPREKLMPIGNSSLRGAEMVLLDAGLSETVDLIASMITYREMNEDSELMSVLQGAMFIPHTQPELLKG